VISTSHRIEGTGPEALSELPNKLMAAARVGLVQGLRVIREVSQRNYLQGPRPERLGVITGRLLNSVRIGIENEGPDRAVGFIESDTPYSKYHEYGFYGKRKLRPVANVLGKRRRRGKSIAYPGRPFLFPAIAASSEAVAQMMADRMAEVDL